jgi:hypothetical protein
MVSEKRGYHKTHVLTSYPPDCLNRFFRSWCQRR